MNLEANFNFMQVKIEFVFCSFAQKSLYDMKKVQYLVTALLDRGTLSSREQSRLQDGVEEVVGGSAVAAQAWGGGRQGRGRSRGIRRCESSSRRGGRARVLTPPGRASGPRN